jgi:hypothetical protein
MRPTPEIIPRHPSVRAPGVPDLPAAAWSDLEQLLRDGSGTTWLSVTQDQA